MMPLKHIIGKGILAICFMYVSFLPIYGQQIGFDFPDDVDKVEIPFERYNNLIVIPVTINNSLTLKFILDTGVQFAILTEKSFAEFLNLEYDRRLVIQGPGMMDSVSAQVATKVEMHLPGGITSGVNQSLLVLEKDYLNLRRNLGADVYGIIGYDIFSRFVVEFDYDQRVIVLHEPRKFRPRKYHNRVPMQVVNTKPYISTRLTFDNGEQEDLNLMVDTGASHAILLDDGSSDVLLPSKTIKTVIGRGLGGDINGLLGRVQKLQINKFVFENPIASFPEEKDYPSAMKRGSRNGTIGGEILTRFHPVFDYFRGVLYLRKSREYTKSFEHDMSGIDIMASGSKFDQIKVMAVREDSPADLAGVEVNDIITSINGFDTTEVAFSAITTTLRLKSGKRINMKVRRKGEIIKTSFRLKRMI
ncbi:aspartyl protease family protein [Reichenbachiella sp. MALMAid0571]|uniref:aspartyl protease family protein n=1 Tax=Reichenbachiella sp. MALMAid0571 TaxID=3143939 RepID=UPI0032DF1AFC